MVSIEGLDRMRLLPCAPVQHHQAKGEIIVDGRDEPPTPGREGRRSAPLAALGRVIQFEHPGSGVGPVAGRQPIELGSRNTEGGVLHAERLEAAFAQECLEQLARGPRDQHA